MSIPEKHHHAQQLAAAQAVTALRKLAEAGNHEAVAAIRDIALNAIHALESIDLGDVPKQSRRWPVVWNAIEEIRRKDFARFEDLEIGNAIGIRTAGKNRGFKPEQPAGLAEELFRWIEPVRLRGAGILDYLKRHPEAVPNWRDRAALLQPLSCESLPAWADLALEVFIEWRMDDLTETPLPAGAQSKVGRDTDGNGSLRTPESAIRDKISEGLKLLIPKAAPRKP